MNELHDPAARMARLREVLGYLNFSEGTPSARFQRAFNELFEPDGHDHSAVRTELLDGIRALNGSSAAFRDLNRADTVVRVVFDRVLPAYREFHADLLFHASDADLFTPYFLVRAFEAALAVDLGPKALDSAASSVIRRLNDFVGYRPVATLENERRTEPYEHERVRPIPLYISAAGVARGPYHELIREMLQILARADSDVCAQAHFDLALMDELAVDPREFDFTHPVNGRPNFLFGEWDPHHLDDRARYRRFVVRRGVLDALRERVESGVEGTRTDRLFESAAALAGVILMASGTCGSGPDTHDSSVTLDKLVPRIAHYRDAFYTALIASLRGRLGDRLQQEARVTRQPFGSVRQYLNQYLARRRAAQIEHQHLATIYATMGFPEASRAEAKVIPTLSARFITEIACVITQAHFDLDQGRLTAAVQVVLALAERMLRGIGCGAFVDPWNILGFQGQFCIFPALENTVHDSRVDVLLDLMERVFTLQARVWREAVAAEDSIAAANVAEHFERLAQWWDQFASWEVGDLRRVHGREHFDSAQAVATALSEWRQAGSAAGDVAFWRGHVERFESPKAYAIVAETLIGKRDYTAAMALLMQWLSQTDTVSLDLGEHSFHVLAVRWMTEVVQSERPGGVNDAPETSRVSRFFDYLEANADSFWEVPQLELIEGEAEDRDDEDPDDDRFAAAYETMSYRDTAEDGHEGSTIDGAPLGREYPLEHETDRLAVRLRFLSTVARLWQIVARDNWPTGDASRLDRVRQWLATAHHNERALLDLMDAVSDCEIPPALGSIESLIEYDSRRQTRASVLEFVCGTYVETAQAKQSLQSVLPEAAGDESATPRERALLAVLRALLAGDVGRVRQELPGLTRLLLREPLLYVAIEKGGRAREVARVRSLQQSLRHLFGALPAAGLLRECYQLLHTARSMEQRHMPGPGAVTEFYRLFQTAEEAVLRAVIRQSTAWAVDQRDTQILGAAMNVVSAFSRLWVAHSSGVRLSSLDALHTEQAAQRLRTFIERYGRDLFTQSFLTLGNLRAILDQGLDRYLQTAAEGQDPLHPVRLLDDLDTTIRREDCVQALEIILQAIIENYDEYKDYNATTTQSDYGDRLYILLEFLRLKVTYERTNWNLRPVAIAHAVLARSGCTAVARQWQDAFAQKTHDVADDLETKLAGVEQAHGVRLASIADRIRERFMKPFALDRITALVEPAMQQARQGELSPAFAILQDEIREYMQTPTGSGLDVPRWLRTIDSEVDSVVWARRGITNSEVPFRIPHVQISASELQRQITDWDEPLLGESNHAE